SAQPVGRAVGRNAIGLPPIRLAVRLNVKEWALPAENTEQVAEEVAAEKADKGHRVQCPRCGSNYMKRMRRAGFLQERVYAILGYFPWRCTKCLGNFMLRKR